MRHPYHIEAEFAMQSVVYLKIAAEPEPGLVIGYRLWCDNSITYVVGWGSGNSTEHFGPELTNEFEPKWHPGGGIATDEP